ncbi:hypothetical protein DUNSADRAFT_8321 [Dunaliella salina]|uniref:Uncharacterized protein n=1 Tax=Dunaliella salina TaxID=3046 RepID=A0ABQ7H5W4_DUNSA|nr:hypothetical protein DUNSADRAFT_8321 [Dunaliella salina]|eukprot:KAF5842258.1 hypothetical protein DUNSADRAFT_8321 [Dunaliella salina]
MQTFQTSPQVRMYEQHGHCMHIISKHLQGKQAKQLQGLMFGGAMSMPGRIMERTTVCFQFTDLDICALTCLHFGLLASMHSWKHLHSSVLASMNS